MQTIALTALSLSSRSTTKSTNLATQGIYIYTYAYVDVYTNGEREGERERKETCTVALQHVSQRYTAGGVREPFTPYSHRAPRSPGPRILSAGTFATLLFCGCPDKREP